MRRVQFDGLNGRDSCYELNPVKNGFLGRIFYARTLVMAAHVSSCDMTFELMVERLNPNSFAGDLTLASFRNIRFAAVGASAVLEPNAKGIPVLGLVVGMDRRRLGSRRA